jgi:hypothetical protein
MWSDSSKAAIVTSGDRQISELDKFISPEGGRHAVKDWLKNLGPADHLDRVGPFKLMLNHARTTIDTGTSAIIHADPRGLARAFKSGGLGKLWLLAMHPWYAVIFSLVSLIIWSLFGGALCRAAALHATRDERTGLRDAFCFAKGKFGSFFAAPLMPAGILVLFGVLLFIGGLVGAIPAIGEVLAGIFFFLALIVGIIMAFVIIGAVAGYSLMFPTIAVEGSDAFDALSRSYSYVYQRPWRTAAYFVASAIYGGICLVFVKLFVRLALWAVHFFVGISMNWGSAFSHATKGDDGTLGGKLNAIWQGPSLTGDTTFWGGFTTHNLAHMSWLGQVLFCIWIFTVVGFVGAFVVSFFYSSSTLIYLLLRRSVDATDLEDVFLEETAISEAAASSVVTPEKPHDHPGEIPPAAAESP